MDNELINALTEILKKGLIITVKLNEEITEHKIKNEVIIKPKIKNETEEFIIKQETKSKYSNSIYNCIEGSKLKYLKKQDSIIFSLRSRSPAEIKFTDLDQLLQLNEQMQVEYIRKTYTEPKRACMYTALKDIIQSRLHLDELNTPEIKSPNNDDVENIETLEIKNESIENIEPDITIENKEEQQIYEDPTYKEPVTIDEMKEPLEDIKNTTLIEKPNIINSSAMSITCSKHNSFNKSKEIITSAKFELISGSENTYYRNVGNRYELKNDNKFIYLNVHDLQRLAVMDESAVKCEFQKIYHRDIVKQKMLEEFYEFYVKNVLV